MCESKADYEYSYQIIDGEVFDLSNPPCKVWCNIILQKKPLLPVLVYLKSQGLRRLTTGWCECAAKLGDLEGLQWLKKNGAPWDEWTCAIAAENGHLEILKWAKVQGIPWDSWTFAYAAQNGNLEVLRWLRENGAPLDQWAFAYAAQSGCIETLCWLRDCGAPWDEWVCSYAAGNGHIETVSWLRSHMAPWNEWVCAAAAGNGYLSVLCWLKTQGAPWDINTCRYALQNSHFNILKWAYAHGCPLRDQSISKNEECFQQYQLEAEQHLIEDMDVQWSMHCKERWSTNNKPHLQAMIHKVTSECTKVTGGILYDFLSELVLNYL